MFFYHRKKNSKCLATLPIKNRIHDFKLNKLQIYSCHHLVATSFLEFFFCVVFQIFKKKIMSCNKKSFSNKSNLLQHRNCGCSNYFYKQDTWLPYTQDILKFLKISEFFDLYFTQADSRYFF